MNNNLKYSYLFEMYQEGKVDLIKDELKRGSIDPLNAMIMFSSWGYLEGMKIVHQFKALREYPIISYFAASGNYFDCLKFLHQNQYQYDYRTILGASENGNIEMIQYLFDSENKNLIRDSDELIKSFKLNLEVAAKKCHLKVLEFFIQKIEEISLTNNQNQNNQNNQNQNNQNNQNQNNQNNQNQNILTISDKSKIIELAAKNGDLESLKYLLDHNFPISDNLIINLFRTGHPAAQDCLNLFRSRGLKINSNII